MARFTAFRRSPQQAVARTSIARSAIHAMVAIALLSSVAPAQRTARDRDERDRVVLDNGKELVGRVLQSYGDEILLMDGGKRTRVDAEDVSQLDTVRSRLAVYFTERASLDLGSADARWQLAEWAEERKLPSLARLEALAAIELDPDHEAAHEFLGHQRRREQWLWPIGSRFVTREKFDEHNADMGHPLELASENFLLITDAGLSHAIATLLDLERLYLWWHDEFGAQLTLEEILQPLRVQVWATIEDFPAWTSGKLGYFVPSPYNDRSYVYFEEDAERPTDLFSIVSQHILYRTLAQNSDPGGAIERFCAALEIGFGEYAQSCMHGRAGRVEPGPAKPDVSIAQIALGSGDKALANVLHLTLRDHFYVMSSRLRDAERRAQKPVVWATAHMFVAYLLDPDVDPELRAGLLTFLRLALREGRGDSSSQFDDALGRPIEKLEKPWREWLAKQTG